MRGCPPVSRRPADAVRAFVDAYNAKSLEHAVALLHEDVRFSSPFTGELVGRDALVAVLQGLFAALPDEHMTIVTLLADEASAMAEYRSSGSAASTGEPFELQFAEAYDVRDGRITSLRVYIDPRQVPS